MLRYGGGLVGRNYGSLRNSYWNSETSARKISTGVKGMNTLQLQSSTTPNATNPNRYTGWNTKNWDFGTASQYPALRYVVGSDIDNPACGISGRPVCGTLLSGQYPNLLAELILSDGVLFPAFNPRIFHYDAIVGYDVDLIKLTATTTDTNAYISVGSNIKENITSGNRYTVENVSVELAITSNTVITVEVTEAYKRLTPYTLTISYD